MVGEIRRKEILEYLINSVTPVSGTVLARKFQVSRQVIVQDIALLRAKNWEILSTNRGYLMNHPKSVERVFWVCHNGEQIEAELNAVVDLGGVIVDVSVQHQVYGELRAPLNIRSRRQVQQFLEDIQSGRSKPLTNLTSGHHCHKICAESEEILDMIQDAFMKMGIFEK
ncbi:MAG: transcription repressor NadR [Blautia sp.]|uniref:transcription repressor NadR n=1 Tax=Blautia sp. TaxID=1955243 RepID=UPI002E75ED3E|nr:transcription repressor NadR [Blautia sp.]MEE1442691.1 transcription repressor NadR [Blautia sp.]